MRLRIFGTSLLLTSSVVAGLAGEARAEVKTTRAAVCRWADAPPKLDGKLDDACCALPRGSMISRRSGPTPPAPVPARTSPGTTTPSTTRPR